MEEVKIIHRMAEIQPFCGRFSAIQRMIFKLLALRPLPGEVLRAGMRSSLLLSTTCLDEVGGRAGHAAWAVQVGGSDRCKVRSLHRRPPVPEPPSPWSAKKLHLRIILC
jgi:hypothetical protein